MSPILRFLLATPIPSCFLACLIDRLLTRAIANCIKSSRNLLLLQAKQSSVSRGIRTPPPSDCCCCVCVCFFFQKLDALCVSVCECMCVYYVPMVSLALGFVVVSGLCDMGCIHVCIYDSLWKRFFFVLWIKKCCLCVLVLSNWCSWIGFSINHFFHGV